MRSLTIQIPTPCPERWDAMQPAIRGRFCASCQKTVIDYTLLSDQELINQLAKAPSNTCGRLYTDQLDRPLLPATPRKKSVWSYWLNLITFGLLSWQSAKAQFRLTGQSSRPHLTQLPSNRPSHLVEPIVTHIVSEPNAQWTISGRLLYVAPSGYLTPVVGADVYIGGMPSVQIHNTYQTTTDSSGSFSLTVPRHQQITPLTIRPVADDFRSKTVSIDASPMTDTVLAGDIIIRKIQPVRTIVGGGLTIIPASSREQKTKRKLFR